MKVAAKVFKGIEYVQVNQLPEDQRENFVQSINDSLFIKILIDGKVLSDCVQFKDYEMWYDGIYRSSVEKRSVTKKSIKTAAVEN